MKTQHVPALLSNCGRLLSRFCRGCKSYILNEKTERDWAECVWLEVGAELEARQGSEALRRLFNGT